MDNSEIKWAQRWKQKQHLNAITSETTQKQQTRGCRLEIETELNHKEFGIFRESDKSVNNVTKRNG